MSGSLTGASRFLTGLVDHLRNQEVQPVITFGLTNGNHSAHELPATRQADDARKVAMLVEL